MRAFLEKVRASGTPLALVGGSDLNKITEQMDGSFDDGETTVPCTLKTSSCLQLPRALTICLVRMALSASRDARLTLSWYTMNKVRSKTSPAVNWRQAGRGSFAECYQLLFALHRRLEIASEAVNTKAKSA